MQSQILVPLDGSRSAEAILPHALLFAQQRQSILTLLQIITQPDLQGVSDWAISDDWAVSEGISARDYLATMVRRLQSSGVKVQTPRQGATLSEEAIGYKPGTSVSGYPRSGCCTATSWRGNFCHRGRAAYLRGD